MTSTMWYSTISNQLCSKNNIFNPQIWVWFLMWRHWAKLVFAGTLSRFNYTFNFIATSIAGDAIPVLKDQCMWLNTAQSTSCSFFCSLCSCAWRYWLWLKLYEHKPHFQSSTAIIAVRITLRRPGEKYYMIYATVYVTHNAQSWHEVNWRSCGMFT